MKVYIATSGTIFGLLTLAHVGRIVLESSALMKDPSYLAITAAAAAMCIWAWRAYPRARVMSRSGTAR